LVPRRESRAAIRAGDDRVLSAFSCTTLFSAAKPRFSVNGTRKKGYQSRRLSHCEPNVFAPGSRHSAARQSAPSDISSDIALAKSETVVKRRKNLKELAALNALISLRFIEIP
jgi:hypothetical protein